MRWSKPSPAIEKKTGNFNDIDFNFVPCCSRLTVFLSMICTQMNQWWCWRKWDPFDYNQNMFCLLTRRGILSGFWDVFLLVFSSCCLTFLENKNKKRNLLAYLFANSVQGIIGNLLYVRVFLVSSWELWPYHQFVTQGNRSTFLNINISTKHC
jgi:hypothetical protein